MRQATPSASNCERTRYGRSDCVCVHSVACVRLTTTAQLNVAIPHLHAHSSGAQHSVVQRRRIAASSCHRKRVLAGQGFLPKKENCARARLVPACVWHAVGSNSQSPIPSRFCGPCNARRELPVRPLPALEIAQGRLGTTPKQTRTTRASKRQNLRRGGTT